MDKSLPNYYRVLKITASLSIMSLVGCAHDVTPSKFATNANPTAEIQNQRQLQAEAQAEQVDVLAAANFKKADTYLSYAQKYNSQGSPSEKVLASLGYSKAYLNLAVEETASVKPNVSEIAEARTAALKAGAKNLPKELNSIDNKLKNMTSDPKDAGKISSKDKSELQSQYLGLELVSIKRANLDEAKSILSLAKKKGAEKITPVAYKQASEKINAAEKIIETDRHSVFKIAPAVEEAKVSSMRVFTLLESEQNSRNQTPEQRAMTLEARDLEVKKAHAETNDIAVESSLKDEKIADNNEMLADKDDLIANQNASIANAEGANAELLNREYDEKIVNNAAAQFDKSEADVYRQEGNLVIRLKKMNFASNRADLPADSIAILNKVKGVMKDLSLESVMVEGHTGAIGNAVKNQKLSEKRAQSVMKFFATEKYLEGHTLDSSGFGYSKPLATNKTAEGRAQNRRVDIVIKTTPVKTL